MGNDPYLNSPTYWVSHWQDGYKTSCVELLYRRESDFRHKVCVMLLEVMGYWALEEFLMMTSEYVENYHKNKKDV